MKKNLLILLTWLVMGNLYAQDTIMKIEYIYLPFELIADTQISISDTDYQNFILENKDWIFQEREQFESYSVSFDVVPSSEDSLKIYQSLLLNSNSFGNNFHDSLSIINNGGKSIYISLGANITDKSSNSPITFIQNNILYVAKLISKKAIADSVRAKHILVRDKALATQLLNDLKTGKSAWTEINKKYSQDRVSAQKDGDLGYFSQGMMVKSFNDLCFNEETQIGSFNLVETQFGNHIVQIIDKKYISNSSSQAQLIAFSIPIIIKEKTIKDVENVANKVLKKSKNYENLEKTLYLLGKKFDERAVYPKEFDEKDFRSNIPKIIKMETNKSISFVIYGNKKTILKIQNIEDIKNQYGYSIKNHKKTTVFKCDMDRYQSLTSLSRKYKVLKKNACFMADNTCSIEDFYLLNGTTTLIKDLGNYSVGQITDAIIGLNGIYFMLILSKE